MLWRDGRHTLASVRTQRDRGDGKITAKMKQEVRIIIEMK
jgi:hypothetical protein